MNALVRDLRYGARMLRKNIGFTAVAVLSLALGIGANTAIFTLIDAVLLKSLPVQRPDELVLFSDMTGEGTSDGDAQSGKWLLFSYPVYEHFRDHNEAFTELCAFRSGEARMSVQWDGSQSREPQRASGHLVSGNYFAVLGVNAIAGRVLTPEDDLPAARPSAVISYGYWKRQTNSDPLIVGKDVLLNGAAFTIVGVTPPEFFGERVRRAPDFWLPLVFQPQIELRPAAFANHRVFWLNVMGRLKPGISIDQAGVGINVQLRQFLTAEAGNELTDERRETIDGSYVSLVSGANGISSLRFRFSQPLKMLLVIVGLVLLIACANVGNLLLSRSASRQMEITMRLAMGASRARLVRQLLTESILLAIIGGVIGMFLASWGVDALVALVAPSTPLNVSPDARVLGFTVAICLLAGIVFGIAPALRASKADLATALKEKSTRIGGGRTRFGLAPALVVFQVALSLVLLVGAGLFARSLINLHNESLGFNRENILLVNIDSRGAGYKPAGLSALYRQLIERVEALPSVRSASLATFSPMSGSMRSSSIVVQDYTPRSGDEMVVIDMLVAPRYCETLGMQVVQGREFNMKDVPGSPRVALINQTFANRFFGGQNPIGRRFAVDDDPKRAGDLEIVGVVADAKYLSAKDEPEPAAYRPILQIQEEDAYSSNLEIRTVGDPLAAVQDIRSAINQVDGRLPIEDVTSFTKQFDDALRQERLIAQLVSFFGLLALVLACVGLYGVMANTVVRRTNEIGVRMALGAQSSGVLWMILRETLMLVVAGIAIGIPAALGAVKLIASQLFGLTAADPLTLAGAAVLLGGVAAVAGLVPARRASRVDPIVALRYE
jgi:predicted permease